VPPHILLNISIFRYEYFQSPIIVLQRYGNFITRISINVTPTITIDNLNSVNGVQRNGFTVFIKKDIIFHCFRF
jgi:hypothetical protein